MNATNAISTMQTLLALFSTTLSLGTLSVTLGQTEGKEGEVVSVFIIDDQTGEELAEEHGIQPLEVSDMEELITVVLVGQTEVRLMHQAVDEDASDNGVETMDFRPFVGGRPPKAPSPTLPLRQLSEEMKRYRKSRSEWQRGILDYRTSVVTSVERFIKGITLTQLTVSERFDEMLLARNGKDFNRSDIVGCIKAADAKLGESGKRFLIINSDAKDLPASSIRPPRTTSLSSEELDSEIELIFVNTSGIPDQSPLFQDAANPVHHADSIRAAMKIVISVLQSLSPEPEEG